VTPLLEARGLVKDLGGRRVVDGVDLVLYGVLRADAGTIRFEDADIGRDRALFKRALGVCTQDDTFDDDFTVRQNLEIAATYFRPRPTGLRERVSELLERFALVPYARVKPEALSGGFRRRLMIARALVHRPRLLFLDEPTTGLDPQARMAVWDLVDGLRVEGLGIVLTTHYMDEAERLSDALTVLAQGRVATRGTPKSVMGDRLGEHVVVVNAHEAGAAAVAAWMAARGLGEPAGVLGAWHIPLRAEALSDFARAFPDLRYEVRAPTLDDLFLTLELGPCTG
jgi:ABC-type multidrug transport system ATPase subunit